MNKGQGLVEYALIALMILIVIVIIIWAVISPEPQVCDHSEPTAGDIVACIATRTAEARNK